MGHKITLNDLIGVCCLNWRCEDCFIRGMFCAGLMYDNELIFPTYGLGIGS